MPGKPAFVGIDVAVSRNKRLPIVVCEAGDGRLLPLKLRTFTTSLPPQGPGNVGIIDADVALQYAKDAAHYLRSIEKAFDLDIQSIAIDAPAGFCADGDALRGCEAALGEAKISFFSTPSRLRFEEILESARKHKALGRDMIRVPHANKLWMIAGFALFQVLGKTWPCLETYPHAIAHALGLQSRKKAKSRGYLAHLQAAVTHSGWEYEDTQKDLGAIAFGDPHDRVDAYLACWVASLPANRRRRYGKTDGDAIWVPRI